MVLQYTIQNSEKYAFRKRDEVQKARVATAASLLTSFIADADVVTDWVYFMEIINRGGGGGGGGVNDNDEEDDPIPSWIRVLQLVSCICGTFSWLVISSDGRLMEWLRRTVWWIVWMFLRIIRIISYEIPCRILKWVSCGKVDLKYLGCCNHRFYIYDVLRRAEHTLNEFFSDGFRFSSGGLLMVGILTEDMPQIIVTFLIEDAMGSLGDEKGISRSAYLNLIVAMFDILHKLASAWDDRKLYIGTGKGIRTFTRHTSYVLSLASVGLDRIISASHDGTARLWEIATGKTVKTFDLGGSGWAGWIAKLGDDRILTTSVNHGNMKVFDIDSGKCLKSIDIDVDVDIDRNTNCFVASNNGEYFLTSNKASNEIKRWDASTLEPVETYPKDANFLVIFNKDDQFVSALRTEGEEGHPILWDVASGDIIRYFNLEKSNSKVTAMCKCNDDSFLVASVDGTGEDALTHVDMFTVGQSDPIKTMTIEGYEVFRMTSVQGQVQVHHVGGDGLLFVTSEWKKYSKSYTADLWDICSGTRLHTFEGGHSRIISDILHLPERNAFATASDDTTVKVWPIPKLDNEGPGGGNSNISDGDIENQ